MEAVDREVWAGSNKRTQCFHLASFSSKSVLELTSTCPFSAPTYTPTHIHLSLLCTYIHPHSYPPVPSLHLHTPPLISSARNPTSTFPHTTPSPPLLCKGRRHSSMRPLSCPRHQPPPSHQHITDCPSRQHAKGNRDR